MSVVTLKTSLSKTSSFWLDHEFHCVGTDNFKYLCLNGQISFVDKSKLYISLQKLKCSFIWWNKFIEMDIE